MRRDFDINQRQPKLFRLYYQSGKFEISTYHSRSVALPPSALQILSSAAFSDTAYSDTDGDVSIETKHMVEVELSIEGGHGDDEVQGDFHSELRGATTAEDTIDGGVTKRTMALAHVLEETSLRVLEFVEGLLPCS